MKIFFKTTYLFFLFLIILSTMCYAEVVTSTNFEVVDQTKCIIEFGENGYFEKQLVSYDENSVTLQLDIKNNSADSSKKTSSEIFFVIDNSLSLRDIVNSNQTRKDLIYDSAKELATKLFETDNDFKIGVISFSSCSDSTKEGTIEDATLKQSLTLDNELVINAIEDINNDSFGSRTNIEAGLELANRNFSSELNKKYIILLTDGVPNDDIHGNTLQYSDIVISNTKNKLIELEQKGINIITVLSGVSGAIEPTVNRTYIELAEDVFGTSLEPTAGKYYCIADSDIETIIKTNVYNDIIVIPGEKLTNIVVKDYFPKEIIDNFDFSYVSTPYIGTVSTEIDKSNNCIIWTIESLEAGETATFQYKLTLIDNYNKEIVDKILPTNEKVVITDDQGDDETSKDSPKVRVTETITEIPDNTPDTPDKTPETVPDNTIAPIPKIPQTGAYSGIIMLLSLLILAFGVYQYIQYKYNK